MDDFDSVSYANKLALFAGVSAGDVSVVVAAASVVVTARIYFASVAEAEAIASELDGASVSDLGASLGVTIESKEVASLEGAPLSTPVLVVAIVVPIVAVLACFLFLVWQKKQLRAAKLEPRGEA